MDTSRISFGEMVAAVSGAALIFVMLVFDWFGYKDVPGGGSAFQWMSFLDIVLLLIGILAIGLAVGRATGNVPSDLPAPAGTIVAGAGALAVLIILFRLAIPGDGPAGDLVGGDLDATRKIGAFLGLITAGGIAFGGWTAANERASGAAPADPGTPPSEPPPTAPPPTA